MHKAEDIEKVLKKFPVGDVWGIGPRYEKMLNAAGVNTAYDFTQMPPQWVRKKCRSWDCGRGKSCAENPVSRSTRSPPRQATYMHVAFVPVRSVGFRHAAYRRSFRLRRRAPKSYADKRAFAGNCTCSSIPTGTRSNRKVSNGAS